MTRKQQLWILTICSALTAAFQYVIQGAMATGSDPSQFPEIFWTIDLSLWGIRSLIEAIVVVYLFTTVTSSSGMTKVFQESILLIMEGLLLALLAYTLGPVFHALGSKTTVYELMGASGYVPWSYAIGLYTSLMMAGAGLGYKIQPWDIEKPITPEQPIAPEVIKDKVLCRLCGQNPVSMREHLDKHMEEIQEAGNIPVAMRVLIERYGQVDMDVLVEWSRYRIYLNSPP